PSAGLTPIAGGQAPIEVGRVIAERLQVAAGTFRAKETSVNLDHPFIPRPLMQPVDVLRDEEETVLQALLDLGEGMMSRVRLDVLGLTTTQRIELPDKMRISFESLGRGDIFDPVLLPQAVRVPKCGKTALRRNARAGQNEKSRSLL